MEKFKIDIFEKDNPSKSIDLISLNSSDSKWVSLLLTNCIKYFSEGLDTQELFIFLGHYLDKEFKYKNDVTKKFLKNILMKLNIPFDAVCFMFWDFESGIDIIKTTDLIEKWDYIWYDTSDEALILFFPSMDKIVLITDHGVVKTR
ncbi:MAG TPA: hypothetical protein P5235_02180 [Saprospiraceae bacterium]|nr:hypothetical protein [Saprospiraceae bacterium]HRX28165.1 hypothetical protein [Saprospiraceae bacterium]